VPFSKPWFWLFVIIILLVAGATSMVLTGNLDGQEAITFFGGPIGGFIGYLVGKSGGK
jgi:hypothetical protein